MTKRKHMQRTDKQLPVTKEGGKQKELTDSEKKRVESFLATRRKTACPLKWKDAGRPDGKPSLSIDLEKGDLFVASAFNAATGSVDPNFALKIISQAMNAVIQVFEDPVEHSNAITAAMTGLAPKDELEGLLAAQMISAHNQAMDCLRRANLKEQSFDGRRLNLTFADRFMRTFAVQVEALTRYRTGGLQKVIVEHVHVYKGGQAIVGTVNHGEQGGDPGRGDERGKGETTSCVRAIGHHQGGVTLPPTRSEEVWCEVQKDRKTLSSAGHGERKV